MVESGEIANIVDPKLRGDFNTNSAWKAVELANACVCCKSTERPNSSQVAVGLNGCLELEIAPEKDGKEIINSTMNLNLDTKLAPLAR